MSHHSQIEFVKRLRNEFPQNFNEIKMMEVGSLNINGSIRHFFNNCLLQNLVVDIGDISNKCHVVTTLC